MAFETTNKNNFQNPDKYSLKNQQELYFKISDYPKEIIKSKANELFEQECISDIFYSVVENSHEGILIFRDNYTILYVNRKFSNIFQAKSEDILNRDFRSCFPGELSNFIIKKIESVKFSSNNSLSYKLNIEQKNGKVLHLDVKLTFLKDLKNKKIIVLHLLDLTDKIHVEKELISAKEKAEKADKLKSEFLAQISHEIRTPINTLMSFAELIENELESVISNDLKTGFDIMQRSGKRIIRTTDLILNMSEMHLGIYEPNLRQIDLFKNVLKVLYEEFKIIAKEKHLSFSVNKTTSDLKVLGDEFTIMQIFRNLIDNAFKYTFFGRVEINLFRTNNEKLTVEVRDTGIGISSEFLPNLFATFSQEEQGYTRKFDGTGLGLALVKQYCKINNAEIEVESKKGIGSTFRVIFN